MVDYKIVGQVYNVKDIQPVKGLLVKAYDGEPGKDTLMTKGYTNNEGKFELTYHKEKWDYFPWPFEHENKPDIYVILKKQTNVGWVKAYQSHTLSNWNPETIANFGSMFIEVPDDDSRTIDIKVMDSDSNPLENVYVKAEDKDGGNIFDPDELMGEDYTDEYGKVRLIYQGRQWDGGSEYHPSRYPDILITASKKGFYSETRYFHDHKPQKALNVSITLVKKPPPEPEPEPRYQYKSESSVLRVDPVTGEILGLDAGSFVIKSAPGDEDKLFSITVKCMNGAQSTLLRNRDNGQYGYFRSGTYRTLYPGRYEFVVSNYYLTSPLPDSPIVTIYYSTYM